LIEIYASHYINNKEKETVLEPNSSPDDQGKEILDEEDTQWQDRYLTLQTLSRRVVLSSAVSTWRGQEYDIMQDVIQETARHLLEYEQKAKRGAVPPIRSYEHLIPMIARNICLDRIRRDRRYVRMESVQTYVLSTIPYTSTTPALDIAVENVDRELLFKLLAQKVVRFPAKQRKALLMDLANRMAFDAEPTPLQQAFLDVGIRLQEYQQPLSANCAERARHSALLHQAYKRISHLNELNGEEYCDSQE
jgi:DNA-directed RNA polymerase specialized sigma24 family protein